MPILRYGVWMVAGTPVNQPYPCLCNRGDRWACNNQRCNCTHRFDIENVPGDCCAWLTPGRIVEGVQRRAAGLR